MYVAALGYHRNKKSKEDAVNDIGRIMESLSESKTFSTACYDEKFQRNKEGIKKTAATLMQLSQPSFLGTHRGRHDHDHDHDARSNVQKLKDDAKWDAEWGGQNNPVLTLPFLQPLLNPQMQPRQINQETAVQNQQIHQLNQGPCNQFLAHHGQHMLLNHQHMQPLKQGPSSQRDLHDSIDQVIDQVIEEHQQQRDDENGVTTAHSNGMNVSCLIDLFFCVLRLLYSSNIFSFFM